MNQKLKKKNLFTPKTQIFTFEKREIIKISLFLNGFRIKIREQIKWKFSKFQRYDLDPDSDPFYPVRIQDPNPHQN